MPTIYSNKDTIDTLPERRPFDFYATDPIVCNYAFDNLKKLYPNRKFSHIIDAGAGTGVWGLAARSHYPTAHIVGIELREVAPPIKVGKSLGKSSLVMGLDKKTYPVMDIKLGEMTYNRWFAGKSYLQVAGYNANIKPKESSDKEATGVIVKNEADLVIGNPPYNLAEDFVIYSIENVLNATGVICMLLQASFLWGERRYSRVNKLYPPKEVVIRKRVSFTGDGKTNGDDYAYYIWEKGYTGKPQISWDIRK